MDDAIKSSQLNVETGIGFHELKRRGWTKDAFDKLQSRNLNSILTEEMVANYLQENPNEAADFFDNEVKERLIDEPLDIADVSDTNITFTGT
jgi:hypothetical protein